jgi:pyruvate kinase
MGFARSIVVVVVVNSPFNICILHTVLLDTKGPEIRSGFFQDGIDKIDLVKGETLVLTSDYEYKCDSERPTKLACTYDKLATSVSPGQQILVADGSLVLTVLTADPDAREITCRIENNAEIGERKNMNLPGVKVELPTFTEKDVDDIVNFGIKHGVEFIAASFVRSGQDVRNLRKLLADNGGSQIKIICKIENQEGLENYDEILKETDGIMVARGDVSDNRASCQFMSSYLAVELSVSQKFIFSIYTHTYTPPRTTYPI